MATKNARHKRKKQNLMMRVTHFMKSLMLIWVFFSVMLVLLFRWLPLPTTSFMLQQRLSADASCSSIRYQWTPWPKTSKQLAIAVIAAEDQKFATHWGLDFTALKSALQTRLKTGKIRGGSTISQQVAKNVFLWPAKNMFRKSLEVYFTLLIELFWSKQRILEVYLNVAQFGECTFGVEQAALQYYHIKASELNGWQAARLASVLPNPVIYRVDRPSSYVVKRSNWIRRQVKQLGGFNYLSQFVAKGK
ncbi:monofunctional biosynthetic peptidoglycan transglycosylase [Zooshikella harenae]|nr:monofunctional biosynthetic peptidoglycan transglycosylase [Zooshikella harenae]